MTDMEKRLCCGSVRKLWNMQTLRQTRRWAAGGLGTAGCTAKAEQQ